MAFYDATSDPNCPLASAPDFLERFVRSDEAQQAGGGTASLGRLRSGPPTWSRAKPLPTQLASQRNLASQKMLRTRSGGTERTLNPVPDLWAARSTKLRDSQKKTIHRFMDHL